jgi:hypothetical protein
MNEILWPVFWFGCSGFTLAILYHRSTPADRKSSGMAPSTYEVTSIVALLAGPLGLATTLCFASASWVFGKFR